MRKTLLLTAVVASASLLAPQTSSAQLTLISPTCTSGNSASIMGYTDCSGAFLGNNNNQQADVATALLAFNGFTTVSQSSNNEGPFTTFVNNNANGLTAGRITFNGLITGSFVLALKTSTAFSLFYYQNIGAGVSFVDFTTAGVALNPSDMPQALSHATLYRGNVNVVPEPSTYALMATGLAGLVGIARRRRQA